MRHVDCSVDCSEVEDQVVRIMRLSSLKLCRFERGVMQTVLARRADIAWWRLSAIENGDAEAQPEELQRIAAALQVPLDALVTRSGIRSAN